MNKADNQGPTKNPFTYHGQQNKQIRQEYSKAGETIRLATGMNEPNDIIHKFATQSETLNNLKDLKQ